MTVRPTRERLTEIRQQLRVGTEPLPKGLPTAISELLAEMDALTRELDRLQEAASGVALWKHALGPNSLDALQPPLKAMIENLMQSIGA